MTWYKGVVTNYENWQHLTVVYERKSGMCFFDTLCVV